MNNTIRSGMDAFYEYYNMNCPNIERAEKEVEELITFWYESSDITNPYMLAAMALTFGLSNPYPTMAEIYAHTEELFPNSICMYEDPQDLFSCEEIEMAQKDYLYY